MYWTRVAAHAGAQLHTWVTTQLWQASQAHMPGSEHFARASGEHLPRVRASEPARGRVGKVRALHLDRESGVGGGMGVLSFLDSSRHIM